jgi:hypothetical protein
MPILKHPRLLEDLSKAAAPEERTRMNHSLERDLPNHTA